MGGRRVTGDDASVDLEERVPADPSSSAVEGGAAARADNAVGALPLGRTVEALCGRAAIGGLTPP